MIIGNTLTFATALELDSPNYCGTWLFGKICYWIGGRSVGNYELGTSLRDFLICLETINKFNGARENKELFQSSMEVAYFSIDAKLFGLFAEDANESVIQVDNADRFDISPWVDVFDYVKIFLIDGNNGISRIIYRNLKTRIIEEFFTPRSAVDDVLSMTYDHLSMLLEKESVPMKEV